MTLLHVSKIEFLNKLNSYNNEIKFTFELVVDGRIPFLDMMLYNRSPNIEIDWYRKPYSSGRMLNYFSNNPPSHKINILKGTLYRMLKLSDKKFWDKNLNIFNNMAKLNNYPKSLVLKIIHNINQTPSTTVPQTRNINQLTTHNNNEKFYPLTYLPIYNNIKTLFRRHNITIVPKTNNNLSAIYNTKDKIDKHQLKNIVYKIKCINCSKLYIGTSGRPLKIRIQEHKRSERDKHKDKTNKTALAKHAHDNGHTFDYTNVEILTIDNNYTKRSFKETCYIQGNINRVVNYRVDTESFPHEYKVLLDTGQN